MSNSEKQELQLHSNIEKLSPFMEENNDQQGPPDESKFTRSLGFVNIYKNGEGSVHVFYKGCVYKEKNLFLTVVQDFCFDETNEYEVVFPHYDRSIPAKILTRDSDFGVTVFEMPISRCESLVPLTEETETEIKWGDKLYLPHVWYLEPEVNIIPTRVCPLDGNVLLKGAIDERFFGNPIVTSNGNIVGVVVNCIHMSTEKATKLRKVWKPIDDPIKRQKRLEKLSRLNLEVASGWILDGVNCMCESLDGTTYLL